MTELPTTAREASYATLSEHAERQAARLIRRARKWHREAILLGPVLLDPEAVGRVYFAIAVPERRRWHFERIAGDDRVELELLRAALVLALASHPPIVLHDMDDELAMVRLCHAILPTEQTATLCREIAAERVARAAFEHPAAEAMQ